MKKRLSIILCIALVLCMIPTSIFASKTVKTKSVSISPKAMVLAVGDIAQLNATKNPAKATDKLTWSTSDKTIATVTKKGVIQGVSEGTATITVKAGKKKANCTVVVKNYLDEDKIRESLKEELKAEFATKNDIKSLISQNTYTKSEIDSKISAIPTGGNGSSDFVDGFELRPYEGSVTLPYTLEDRGHDVSVTVKSITVKKYHYNSFDGGTFYPYKYVITIKGESTPISEGYSAYISLGMMENNKSTSFGAGVSLYSSDISSDNSFEKTEETYAGGNCDYYYLKDLDYEGE